MEHQHHPETLASLEFIPYEMDKARGTKSQFEVICKKSGLSYITNDLTGYRRGAMNEVPSNLDKYGYQKRAV